METIELFSGTQSFSKVAKERGHKTFCIDNNPRFNNDMTTSILRLKGFVWCMDLLWASPPCTTFSIASCYHHWNKDKTPKTKECKRGLELLRHTVYLISKEKPKYWFIENPRGLMRKHIDKYFEMYGLKDVIRHTVTYCQYGDTRMKPTDIWTNCKEWKPKPMCKNGDPCHVSAPRGSRTGTQGLKNNMERSVIPPALFEEIFDSLLK